MKQFWKDTLERAIKTAAQTALAMIGTGQLIESVDWKVIASATAMATILSVLTSVASKTVGNDDSASLVDKEDK